MFTAQIVFDSTSSQVWPGNRIRYGALLGDDANIFCPIDKNFISGQQPVAFVETRTKVVEKFVELWDKAFWKIADLSAQSRLVGGELCYGSEVLEFIKLFALGA